MSRPEMMRELTTLQNQIDYQDVLTITAFMDDAAVGRHLGFVRLQAARARQAKPANRGVNASAWFARQSFNGR